VDAAHDKEIKAKENIITLKQEISRLTQLAEQGAGLSEGQEHRYVVWFMIQCCY
jgi:hypothetical protein